MYVVHTKTQEQFDKVMEVFNEYGLVWLSGKNPTDNFHCWERYGKDTCVDVSDNFAYSHKNAYKKHIAAGEDYDIITFNKFMKNKEQIMDEVDKTISVRQERAEEIIKSLDGTIKSLQKVAMKRDMNLIAGGFSFGVLFCTIIQLIIIILK